MSNYPSIFASAARRHNRTFAWFLAIIYDGGRTADAAEPFDKETGGTAKGELPLPSERLRISDVRAVDRLVGECLELWSDPVAWQTHLLAEAARLLGLRVGLCAELSDFDVGQTPKIVAALEHGWDGDKQRRAFMNSATPGGPDPFSASPIDVRFRELLGPRRALTRARGDLMSDAAWREQPVFHETHRPAGMDEVLYSAVRSQRGDGVSLLAFGGDESTPGPRQRKLLALLHHEIARRHGKRLALGCDPGPHRLSPRQRAVYDLVIQGCDDKTIARRLHRTRSTISEHLAAIYAEFGVNGRVELLAQLLRRKV